MSEITEDHKKAVVIKQGPIPRQLFYVVFHDRLTRHWHWWNFFTRPGFYHVFVIKKTLAGCVLLQPLMRTWLLEWYPKDADVMIGELLRDDRYRVLCMDRPAEARYNRFGPIHCVSVVKACMGIKSNAITPYQLYKDLLQMGAVEVKL